MISSRPFTAYRSFCHFLLWLVVLAVPLQGFAAAAMVHCDSDKSAVLVNVATAKYAAQQHSHPQHHGLSGEASSHYLHQPDAAASAGEQPSDLQTTTGSTDFLSHTCSACAACCHLLALGNSRPALAQPEHQAALFLDLPLPALGIAPRLSEKPPRF